MKDIFSDMKTIIGCSYISDLPHRRYMVWNEMKYMYLADYSQKQIEDFLKYVFGTSWQTLNIIMEQKDMGIM